MKSNRFIGLAIVFFTVIALVGCGVESVDTTADVANDVLVEEMPAIHEGDAVEVEANYEFSRESMVAESDAVLEDDTGYGFAYDASNVLDLDYSTAWCLGDFDRDVDGPWAGELTLYFPSSPSGMTFGVVPGFARDETIFYQNNRIKTLTMRYGGAMAYSETFEFEDEYGMQFFEMPDVGDYTSFSFYVTDVYPGSKYDDTCIAEIDYWSDWVDTKDADAAYNYYQEYKASAALRPVGVEEMLWTVEGGIESCGKVDYSKFDVKTSSEVYGEAYGDEMEFYYWKGTDEQAYIYISKDSVNEDSMDFSSERPMVSVELNEWAELGDEFEFRWVIDSFIMPSDEYPKYLGSEAVEAKECSDGSLYVASVSPAQYGVGHYTVSVYYEGRLVGKRSYSMAQ